MINQDPEIALKQAEIDLLRQEIAYEKARLLLLLKEEKHTQEPFSLSEKAGLEIRTYLTRQRKITLAQIEYEKSEKREEKKRMSEAKLRELGRRILTNPPVRKRVKVDYSCDIRLLGRD